jgi:hypothetical protein
LCLITFELVFDRFDICIERDEGSDIYCVFGLMISDLVKEVETWKEVALFFGFGPYLDNQPLEKVCS